MKIQKNVQARGGGTWPLPTAAQSSAAGAAPLNACSSAGLLGTEAQVLAQQLVHHFWLVLFFRVKGGSNTQSQQMVTRQMARGARHAARQPGRKALSYLLRPVAAILQHLHPQRLHISLSATQQLLGGGRTNACVSAQRDSDCTAARTRPLGLNTREAAHPTPRVPGAQERYLCLPKSSKWEPCTCPRAACRAVGRMQSRALA